MQLTVFTTIFHIFLFIQSCQAILNTNAKSNVALYWVRQFVQSISISTHSPNRVKERVSSGFPIFAHNLLSMLYKLDL